MNVFNVLRLSKNFYSKAFKFTKCDYHNSIGIIGAPLSKGGLKKGAEDGPIFMRNSGIIKQLQYLGHDVKDYGDLQFETNKKDNEMNRTIIKNPFTVADACEKLSAAVTAICKDSRIPITIGGDHSLAVGTITGNAKVNNDLSVLYIDAHADINTAKTTTSGNIHGMPLSFVVKEIAEQFHNPNADCPGMGKFKPCISAKNLAFIGLRDVEIAERDILNGLNICHFTMKDVDKLGIHEVISRALDSITDGNKRKLHVSLDIDSIDGYSVPSTVLPTPAGLTLREAFCIGEEIHNTKLLSGFDIFEVNPMIGNEHDVEKTVTAALNIVLAFFGKERHDLYARMPKKGRTDD